MTKCDISTDLTDYHGCGSAWAAVVDGVIVALRYMGDHPTVCASEAGAKLTKSGDLDLRTLTPRVMRRCDDLDEEEFLKWRKKAKMELAEIPGATVISGMCSCHEFIVNYIRFK